MINDAINAIRKFADVLSELDINYYIGGSIASIVYGKARTTRDVDFVLTLQARDGEHLVERLSPKFHVDAVAVNRSIATGDCFNALDLESIFQVDVFTPHDSPWMREQYERKQLHRIGGGDMSIEVFLCSPEDVVLNKLEWFRLGNEISRLQWDDAVGVLTVQRGRLDLQYMSSWADRQGLSELLRRALDSC